LATQSRLSDAFRLLGSLLAVGVFGLAARKLGLFEPDAAARVATLTGGTAGIHWIVPAFIAVYAAITALGSFVTPLSYGAGAVFGFVRGAIFVWIASMFGAVIGYFVARGVWSRPARRLLGPRAEKLEGLRKGNVALTAFRMQLMPLIPFGVFNYAAGISRLPLAPFLIGTAFGIIPGTLLATYVGDRFVAGIRGEDRKPLYIALAVTIVLFGLSFLPKLIEKSRQR
jgi:uncharacterized membrane protein YdjX (TVP38/TMEM64 family)